MITVPLNDIKAKIKEQSSLSEDEINTRIKKKLDDLSGLISEEGAAQIIANELDVKIIPPSGPGEKLQVKNILSGMRNIEVNGKVTKKYELKEFQTENRSGKLASFMMADETGFIRVVLWNDQTDNFPKINEGDIVKIEGGYVRNNNGRKEIHLGDRGNITVNPAGIDVKEVERPKPVKKQLSDLKEGDENVEILGTIVQVFEPRFFEVDPNSGKRAIQKDGKYFVGDKEIEKVGYAYVMNLFLDDGTENIRTVLWRNQIQNLLGKKHEEILAFKENPSDFDPYKTELLGTIVKVIGRVSKNQSFDRLELIANIIIKNVDPEEEIRKVMTEKEEKGTAEEKKEDDSPKPEEEKKPELPPAPTKPEEDEKDEPKEEPNSEEDEMDVERAVMEEESIDDKNGKNDLSIDDLEKI